MSEIVTEHMITPHKEDEKFTWEETLSAIRKSRLTSPKTLSICGFAQTSRHWCDFDRRTQEIWGCNEAYRPGFMKTKEGKFRADRWFQMHLEEDWSRENNPNDPRHPEWIGVKHNFPIVMQEGHYGPSVEAFPLDECDELFFKNVKTLGPKGEVDNWIDIHEHGYYTSSFAWMLAYALWQKITGKRDWDIVNIYGFNTAAQSEYMYQKAGAEFWLSKYNEHGIDLRIAGNSPLMRAKLYGYEVGDVLLPTHLEARLKELNREIPPLQEAAMQKHGARLMMAALGAEADYAERLPEILNIHNLQQQDELSETAKVNFYRSAASSTHALLEQLSTRHEGTDGLTGNIDRMTLEVHKWKYRTKVIIKRGELDAVSGALAECRRNQEIYPTDDAELLASQSVREVELINKLIKATGELNALLGIISNLEYFMFVSEGRSPNVEDEHEYGYIVVPDLFDENTDMLTLGDEPDGETREEEPTETDEGRTEGSTSKSGESA